MDFKKIPQGTIERLSKYRRCLTSYCNCNKDYIFSHELATNLHLTPEQVRRDMMLIGHSGSYKNGYNIQQLIEKISNILDGKGEINVAIIGLGNLGKAVVRYILERKTKLNIEAIFDINFKKPNQTYINIQCYNTENIKEVIKEKNIKIAILTLPGTDANEIVSSIVNAGITGIMNFTPVPLKLPEDVFLEEYDILSSLEKVAFFTKRS